MSLVEELHTARKARLVRLGAIRPQRAQLAEAIRVIKPVKEPAPIPVDVVKQWVERQMKNAVPIPKATTYPTIEEIQRAVCAHFNVSRIDMISPRRHKDIVLPRQIAVFLAKELTVRSLPEIGRRFGGRDHTTAIASIRKITRLLPIDRDLSQHVESIRSQLARENQ